MMGQDGTVTNVMNSPGDDKPQLIVVQSEPPASAAGGDGLRVGEADGETLEKPGKVMRIGSMIRQLLEEVRQAPLDEASRVRLREIYDTSVAELSDGPSQDLRDE